MTKAEARSRLDNMLKQLEMIIDIPGARYSGDPLHIEGPILNELSGRQTYEFKGPIYARIDSCDGTIYGLINSVACSALSALPNDNERRIVSGDKRSSTERVVRLIAKLNYPVDLRIEDSIPTKYLNDNIIPGAWEYRWIRKYRDYNFRDDDVLLYYNEFHGILWIRNTCISCVPECIDVRIDKEKAVVLALPVAQMMTRNIKYKPHLNGYSIGKVRKIIMEIVNPNISETGIMDKGRKKSRLAWTVEYTLDYQGSPTVRWLSVWLDAYDGSNLGGAISN